MARAAGFTLLDETGRALAFRDTLEELSPIAAAYILAGASVSAIAPDGSAATIPEWIRPDPSPALGAAAAALDRAERAADLAAAKLERARSIYRAELARARQTR